MSYKIENRRYIGSKAKLLDFIFKNILKYTKGEIFLDLFAGTGIVSMRATRHFKKIVINDFLYSNNAIYNGFFKGKEISFEKMKVYLEGYNKLNSSNINGNYFFQNFSNKYFGENDSKKIGHIREDIEKLYFENKINVYEKDYLLTCLIYSIDRISNTVGHYEAYRKIKLKDNIFEIKEIERYNLKNEIEIYRKDANLLSKEIKADIVFIDPPYNSRQYSRFYHLLETLVKWEKPILKGVALKPPKENMSKYCGYEAKKSFKDLIENLECKYIVLTYNNTDNPKSNSSKNKMSYDDIVEILRKKGILKIFEKEHSFFNTGKTNFTNHKEFLFIVEVKTQK